MQYTIIWIKDKKTGERYAIRFWGYVTDKEAKKIARANGGKCVKVQRVIRS